MTGAVRARGKARLGAGRAERARMGVDEAILQASCGAC